MPPKREMIAGSRSRASKGAIASTYSALTSPENASVVKSVAIFGVRLLPFPFPFPPFSSLVRETFFYFFANLVSQAAVAFFASPWSEFLLPP
jgi:hypothetical protein